MIVRVKPLGEGNSDVIFENAKFSNKFLKSIESNKIMIGDTANNRNNKYFDKITQIFPDTYD